MPMSSQICLSVELVAVDGSSNLKHTRTKTKKVKKIKKVIPLRCVCKCA